MFTIQTLDLASLPAKEQPRLEYKSSVTPTKQLAREIANAASAFWNTGGGMFIAGIADKTGKVDGGIDCSVSRQPIEDWLAQILADIRPRGPYTPRLFATSDHPSIGSGKCVLAIEFRESHDAPHQSKDSRYYIRAGTHTLPASHDLVDALFARRKLRKPRLVHIAKKADRDSKYLTIIVDIVAATDEPAFDVKVDCSPRPRSDAALPYNVPIIDRSHPFRFDFCIERSLGIRWTLKIDFLDFAENNHEYEAIFTDKDLLPFRREVTTVAQLQTPRRR